MNVMVSVLMTSFNREKYIGFAIESVLASTFINFELIIVDDKSRDNTVEVAKSYAAKDARVKVYENEENLGDYPNRNRAATLASGKYIKYVDSDDYIYPTGLAIMIEAMEQYADAGFGMSSIDVDSNRPFPFMLNVNEIYKYHFFKSRIFHKGPLAAIIRREVFNKMGGFPPGRMISDTEMWHHMGLMYPIVLIQNGVVWQRRHAQQELSDQNLFTFKSEKIKWKFLESTLCTLSKCEKRQIKKKCLKKYFIFILSGIRHFNIEQVRLYLKCSMYVSRVKIH